MEGNAGVLPPRLSSSPRVDELNLHITQQPYFEVLHSQFGYSREHVLAAAKHFLQNNETINIQKLMLAVEAATNQEDTNTSASETLPSSQRISTNKDVSTTENKVSSTTNEPLISSDAAATKYLMVLSENKRLKRGELCQCCFGTPRSLTFLPCGHFHYCVECGNNFSRCPLCKKTILADVKTFLV